MQTAITGRGFARRLSEFPLVCGEAWRLQRGLLSSGVPGTRPELLYALPRVPIVQRPRTWPFQGQNTGSNPVGDATACGQTIPLKKLASVPVARKR